MSKSTRSARRAQLFSLAARFARAARNEPPTPTRMRIDLLDEGDAPHGKDDGCPICVAERSGVPFDMGLLAPSADGGPPRLDPKLLIGPARKALAKQRPAADVAVSFFDYGVRLEDGTVAEAAFEVDGAGRIFWRSPTQRTFVAHVAPN